MHTDATIDTARLYLRPCRADDLDIFLATWGDPGIMRTFGPGVPVAVENMPGHLDNYIDGHEAGRMRAWTIVVKPTGEKVGLAYLRWEDHEEHTLSIGFLVRPEEQGKGYATEAARAAIRFALCELNPYQVVATVMPRNVPSVRVIQNAGLVYSHALPEWNRNLYAITNPRRADE